jgi:hypothetical protein
MADEPNTGGDEGRKDSFFRGLTGAVARKALVPLAASAATAGTAYLTKKWSELWREKLLPKVQEKGGGRAVAKEAVEKVSGKLGGRGSQQLSALAKRIEPDGGHAQSRPTRQERQEEPEPSDERREQEREERRRRREQRQETLQQSGSS